MDWNNEEDDRLKFSTDTNLFWNQKLFYFIGVSFLQHELTSQFDYNPKGLAQRPHSTSENTHLISIIYVAFDFYAP